MRAEDGDPRTQPPSNEVTSTKTRTTIPYLFRVFQFFAILRNKSGRLLRVFVFRCDARNRNHRDTRESKHSRPIGRANEIGDLRTAEANFRSKTPPQTNGGHHIRDARQLEGKPCGAYRERRRRSAPINRASVSTDATSKDLIRSAV